jgi:hypothetical protein
MSRAKMEVARDLIKSGRHNEARAILRTVNHPLAAEWLAKLDNMEPVEPKVSRLWFGLIGILTIIFVVTVIVLGAYLQKSQAASESPTSAASMVSAVAQVVSATEIPTIVPSQAIPTYTQVPGFTQPSNTEIPAIVPPTDTEVPPTLPPTLPPSEIPLPTSTHTAEPTNTEVPPSKSPVPTSTQVPPTETAEPTTTEIVPVETTTNSTPNPRKWVTETQRTNADKPFVILHLVADLSVKGSVSSSTPVLYLRCENKLLQVSVATGMLIETIDNLSMAAVSFDFGESQQLQLHSQPNKDTLVFDNPQQWIEQFQTHDTLSFRFTPLQAVEVETKFDLRGLADAIKPLRDLCPAS